MSPSANNSPSPRAILQFWRDIEFFLPFRLDEAYDEYKQIIPIHRVDAGVLPWADPATLQLDEDTTYGFDIFVAPFRLEAVLTAMTQIIPEVRSEVLPDPRAFEGLSCVMRLTVAPSGIILLGDTKISTLPWALMQLHAGQPLSLREFDSWVDATLLPLRGNDNDWEVNAEGNLPTTLSHALLCTVIDQMAALMPLPVCHNNIAALAVVRPLGKKNAEKNDAEKFADRLRLDRKVDILNSFYLRDLERCNEALAGPPNDRETPLATYLAGDTRSGEKIDLFSQTSRAWVYKHITKSAIPSGRWPAAASQNNSCHQQLALSLLCRSQHSLHAINGPPGTGKTTLVRDLLAHQVVERACALARLGKPAAAYSGSLSVQTSHGRDIKVRVLHKDLQGFGMVVASANNAAVENISLTLPQESALDPLFRELRYLTPVARLFDHVRSTTSRNKLSNEQTPLWGLPSIALGNRKNRALFTQAAIFFDKGEEAEQTITRRESGLLLTLLEWRNRADESRPTFHQARKNFLAAYTAYEAWRKEAEETLPSDLSCISDSDWHMRVPWLVDSGNTIRSECFIRALELHEAWVREVPYLETELRAIGMFLSSPQRYASAWCAAVWEILSLMVPLVSTTLASVERMLAQLPAQSLGLVVIDEAGQATPQSVAGILMRAQKTVAIGDQRQLTPIMTIPNALVHRIAQRTLSQHVPSVSPLYASAQSIADSTSPVGGWFQDADGNSSWLGTPLVVHRRCASPMFEIANEIAYEGRMIQAQPRTECHPILGASTWFDVAGKATNKQWVPEQGSAAQAILEVLLSTDYPNFPDVFFVTPFRAVREELKKGLTRRLRSLGAKSELLNHISSRVNTIHGKRSFCYVVSHRMEIC